MFYKTEQRRFLSLLSQHRTCLSACGVSHMIEGQILTSGQTFNQLKFMLLIIYLSTTARPHPQHYPRVLRYSLALSCTSALIFSSCIPFCGYIMLQFLLFSHSLGSVLHAQSSLLRPLLTSCHSLLLRFPADKTSSGKSSFFPSIYPPSLHYICRLTFGLYLILQAYPHILPKMISVRQTRVFKATSLSYHISVSTLWFTKISRKQASS